jgi:hypothetical protein
VVVVYVFTAMFSAPCFLSNGTFICAYMNENHMSLQLRDTPLKSIGDFTIYNWGLIVLVFLVIVLSGDPNLIGRHREILDEKDQLDDDILKFLEMRQKGMTTRMLGMILSDVYPELDVTELSERLHTLKGSGLVRKYKGRLRTPLWKLRDA